ncbi:hypothetical protein [Dryocola clanedunensis]|uniref:hypothetical protein n=1 Tax=Cedecea sulfonylureivorans TaxID=3051154 RepID=UPI001926E1B5|nr:hypothetical protein [Cedecea sulfonylureivorans]
MTNKQLLLQLYTETVTLGRYIELEEYAKYPLTAMHPNLTPEDLNEEELIKLITASVTNMTGQVC